VVFHRGAAIPGINDSKKLTPPQRDALFDLILEKALAVGVGSGDHLLIDRVNILQATLFAMKEAVLSISPNPDYLIIDGISKIPVNIHQRTIKKGDCASLSIAAASIIAKVTRDRLMAGFDNQYPGYGFAGHKGYGCAAHLEAIARLGPCRIHRKTFRGVKEHVKCDV
jgi:ribonuclease HII